MRLFAGSYCCPCAQEHGRPHAFLFFRVSFLVCNLCVCVSGTTKRLADWIVAVACAQRVGIGGACAALSAPFDARTPPYAHSNFGQRTQTNS